MKNDLKKRILCVFLTLALVLGNVPVTVLAEEEDVPAAEETLLLETTPTSEPETVPETTAATEPETEPETEPGAGRPVSRISPCRLCRGV